MKIHSIVKSIIKTIENGVFVKIGTHLDDFAEFILENSVNSILYCVDPDGAYADYDDISNTIDVISLEASYDKLKSKYKERIIFVRKYSTDAINDIPNRIDFLYIDGNHKYKSVLENLRLYYPKAKQNCYIVGDDAVDTDDSIRNENGDVSINWGNGYYMDYGVIKAFDEFCKINNLSGKPIGNQYIIMSGVPKTR